MSGGLTIYWTFSKKPFIEPTHFFSEKKKRELIEPSAPRADAELVFRRAAAEREGDGGERGWWAEGRRFSLWTDRFLPLASGNGSIRGYRGIPLNTARIQISNQNRKPLVQTVPRGIPRYKPFLPRGNEFIPVQRKRPSGLE
jgi:hypothetical protein